MQCREAEGLLPAYADDVLPPRVRERVETHLHDCAACQGELESLHRSLEALSTASPGDSPDLWPQFQARRAGRVPCAEVLDLLSDYVDGILPAAQHVTVATHLDVCAACTHQEQLLTRSLEALDRSARRATDAAPDLWAAFSARLAEELSCAQVEERLPVYLDRALEGADLSAVRFHLEHCPACERSAAVYSQSVNLLDRVGGATPEVDLWPAFAARLAREEEAARNRGFGGVVRALDAWLRRPLAAPALALAAGVVVLLFLRPNPPSQPSNGEPNGRLVQSFPLPDEQPERGEVSEIEPERTRPAPEPARRLPVRSTPTRRVSRRQPRAYRPRQAAPRVHRTLVVAARPRVAPATPPVVTAKRPQPENTPGNSISSQLTVAINPDLPETPAPLTRTASASGMPSGLTQDLAVLAVSFERVSDAVNSPLGSGRDDEK